MHGGTMAKQVAKWVALGALFLLPFTPLIVASDFFFPFITGKAFYMRILIEIAVVAWIVLALLDKEYRPRFSWIGASVVGFVVWMFIADAFALNAVKAFWSNFERMEGWVLLAHLLGLFFAMSAILRAEGKWRAWFLTSLGVSVILVGYAFLQLNGTLAIHQGSTRIDASLGNSAYFAIYLLFSVFVALWLALTEKHTWLKWSLIALATVQAVLIFFTETRGTIIGLVLALALAALLTAVTAGRRARTWAVGALVLILVLVGSFYLARNSSFVQNNSIFQRLASISLTDGQTRFTIWGMAFKGVMERPLTGYGQEGFNYVFNKHYDPSLYMQEQWFDRAHNAFIDWFAAGGIPAFLLYLSLFGSALLLLWRSSELSRPERTLLTAALVGYAVHNLFVFDNLYSYIYFFAILALIDSQVSRPIERFEDAPELSDEDCTTYALPIAAVVLSALIWFVNISGMQTASKLITAISPSADLSKNFAAFEYFAEHPPFAMQEVREQLVSFASAVVQNQSVPNEQKQRIASLAITEMQKHVERYPMDARSRIQLAYAYRIVGDTASALKEIESAILLSPKKIGFYIEKGAIEWDAGDMEAAKKSFNSAYALGPQFSSLAVYAAAGNIANGDKSEADKILMDVFGTIVVDNNVLAAAYYRTQDWRSLINMLKLRTESQNTSVEAWFSLAAAYYTAGDKANAIKAINTAIAKYPDSEEAGVAALKQIQAGE
ncbi:MAG: O-antigen ligase family protein [Candidatus Woesebacteria bacterium]|nr:O-antigen ligase family protein [Candidatus Woesebacteria bacterium]